MSGAATTADTTAAASAPASATSAMLSALIPPMATIGMSGKAALISRRRPTPIGSPASSFVLEPKMAPTPK